MQFWFDNGYGRVSKHLVLGVGGVILVVQRVLRVKRVVVVEAVVLVLVLRSCQQLTGCGGA